jgi:cytochrome P450
VDFSDDRLAFYTRTAQEHGDVAAFRLGPRRCILLSHPDYIEQVLVTESRHFRKHFALRLNRLLLGNGLLSSDGDFWLRQRRLAQPAFLRERVASYGESMVACARRQMAAWRGGETRDLHREMTDLTLEIVAETLFGADVVAETRRVAAALEVAGRTYAARLRRFLLVPEWLPTPTNLRLRSAVRQLDEILYRIIKQRRHGPGREDLLSLLLRAQDEDGSGMTDQQLRDEAMTLFLAGHETTALLLSWTWYLLAQHPDVEARLLAELRTVLNGRDPTPADLPRLPYAERIITESMRLYPPVHAVGREALRECQIGGYRVPPGTTVFMSQWVMHRDPRFFADPLVFRPDRWIDESIKRLPKYAYFPFGGGPRICMGNMFATMEALLVLATVAPRFKFTLVPGHPVRPRAFLTVRPESGIQAVLTRRREDP